MPWFVGRRANKVALSAVAQTLLDHPSATSMTSGVGARMAAMSDGRARARMFEKRVLGPFLVAHEAEVRAAVDAALAALPGPWRFRFVAMPQVEEERAGLDFWLALEVRVGSGPAQVVRQMVNVKYTQGKQEDNTAGKTLATWAFRGVESEPRSKRARGGVASVQELGLLSSGLDAYADRHTDYLFLVFFNEGPKASRMVSRVRVLSLLEIDPEVGVKHNVAQPWPSLQIDFGRAQTAPLASITAERRRLVLWLHLRQGETLREQLAEHTRAARLLGTAPVTLPVPRRQEARQGVLGEGTLLPDGGGAAPAVAPASLSPRDARSASGRGSVALAA